MYKFLHVLSLCIASIIHYAYKSNTQSSHFLLRIFKCFDTLCLNITISCSIESSYMKMFCSCVGDGLLTRISALYKPSEIENLSDRRDRIQSRLYTKMLNILTEEEPNPEKEVWSTAATLYR